MSIRFAQIYKNEETCKWYLLISKSADLVYDDTMWTGLDELGNSSLTPCVNIIDTVIECEDYDSAMLAMAEHYASEYKKATV